MQHAADTTRPLERPARGAATVRLGGYRLYEQLGKGGQACVYRARRIGDPDGGDVALKRLHDHLLDDAPSVQAFGREARIAYLVDHPVIRRVFALCRVPDALFMTMEYVEGVSLATILRRARAARRQLPLGGVLATLHRLCGALHYAHELVDERGAPAGLVHRDVSPENLIVSAAGRLKLIDLGIVSARVAEHATNSGLIKGKYGYMAPEVLRCAPFDRRADVFSIGVVAWELLTARKLYAVSQPSVDLEQVRARPIEPPSTLNPACPGILDAIVLRALAPDPAARWATCDAMAEALCLAAARMGESLADGSIAALAEVHMEQDRDRAVASSSHRSRLARGTPAEVPTSNLLLGLAPPRPLVRPCLRCRRSFGVGVLGGAAAMLLGVIVASYAFAAAPPAARDAGDGTPPRWLPRAAPPAGRGAGAWTPPPAADVPVPAPAPAPAQLPASRAAVAAVAASFPRRVDPAEVTRIAGHRPRSRSTSTDFHARVCIDAAGTVIVAGMLDGPERLADRVVRTLLRWRYQPYVDAAGARPVCFDVESRIDKIPRAL